MARTFQQFLTLIRNNITDPLLRQNTAKRTREVLEAFAADYFNKQSDTLQINQVAGLQNALSNIGVQYQVINKDIASNIPDTTLNNQSQYNDWVLGYLRLLAGNITAPAKPANPQTDDVGDTFSVDVVPGYTTVSDYQGFSPYTGGTVVLTAATGYIQNGRVYLKVIGPAGIGDAGISVAASGSRPAGPFTTNLLAFTGTPASAQTKAVAPVFGVIDDVNNTVTLSSQYAYTEVRWGIEGNGPQVLASNSICSPGNITGRLFAYVTADAASNRLQSDTIFSTPFSAATNTNSAPTASLAVAGGVSIVNIGQSVTLQGTATDANGQQDILKIEYFDNGVKLPGGETTGASGSLQTPALTAGSHSFTCRAVDQAGATGLSNAVVVSAQGGGGSTSGITKVLILDRGTSLEQADQAAQEKGYALHTGTNAIQTAQGAIGNIGRVSSVEQMADILNGNNLGIMFTGINLGYPGKSCYYFERSHLSTAYNGINVADYDLIINLVSYGPNCLVYKDDPSDSLAPVDVYNCIVRICQGLTAGNSKYRAFITPCANRTYNNPQTGQQQAEFVDFDSKRQELNRYELTNLNSFAQGAANIFEFPVGQAGMCFNYPNAEVVDGTHWTYKAQGEVGLAKAQMIARYFNFTLSQGNGTAPVAPAAAGAPPAYSTTAGFVVWEGGDGEAVVDSGNPRRIYKTSNTNTFGGTKYGNILARNTPGSTVQWQLIVQVKAAAGATQLVTASSNLGITHYQDGNISVYWNGSNYKIFEGITELYSGTLSSDFPIQVVATDKIRCYRISGNTATLIATSSAATPATDVCVFAEMGGTPVNGKPEILDVQFFPATAVSRSGVTIPGTPVASTETIIANPNFTQNLIQDGSSYEITVQGTGFTRDKFTTATKRVLGAYLPGTRLTAQQVAQPASNDQRGRFIGLASAPIPLGTTDWLPLVRHLFYWDGTVLRTFINGTLHVNGLTWLNAVDDLSIDIAGTTISFLQGSTVVDQITDSYSGDLYPVIGGGEAGVVIPKTVLTSSGISTY